MCYNIFGEFFMEKKVVIVTGSSRGLGRIIIERFAKEGYAVVINYNDSFEEAKSLYNDIVKKTDALMIKADVSNEEEVNNMVSTVYNEYGRIDCLVNNAGIALDSTFYDKSVENFKKILDVNLVGTFIVSKAVSKYMLKQGYGNIINISSTNGIDTYYPYSMDYDASKAGVISLTHNLAVQFSPNIRVNCVAPGWIDTDMNKNMDEEFRNKEEEKILLKRFATCDEVANVVYFLSSDEASYVNGSIIRVDGGY